MGTGCPSFFVIIWFSAKCSSSQTNSWLLGSQNFSNLIEFLDAFPSISTRLRQKKFGPKWAGLIVSYCLDLGHFTILKELLLTGPYFKLWHPVTVIRCILPSFQTHQFISSLFVATQENENFAYEVRHLRLCSIDLNTCRPRSFCGCTNDTPSLNQN